MLRPLAACACLGLALSLAFPTTALAQTPPVTPAPAGTARCPDGADYLEQDGSTLLFKWCAYDATQAQRDLYLRPNNGAPWSFRNSTLWLCSDPSNIAFIKSRNWLGGFTGDQVYAAICP